MRSWYGPVWNVADVQTKADAGGASGTVVAMSPGPDEPSEDRHQGITLFTAGGNLAAGRPVRLEGGVPGPAEMTDGKPDTAGYLNKGAPTWVEVDLDQPSTLAGVELVTAQERAGITIHEVWVTTADGQFRGMHTFVGPTADNQTLSVHFDAPVANVKSVRIATTQVQSGGRSAGASFDSSTTRHRGAATGGSSATAPHLWLWHPGTRKEMQHPSRRARYPATREWRFQERSDDASMRVARACISRTPPNLAECRDGIATECPQRWLTSFVRVDKVVTAGVFGRFLDGTEGERSGGRRGAEPAGPQPGRSQSTCALSARRQWPGCLRRPSTSCSRRCPMSYVGPLTTIKGSSRTLLRHGARLDPDLTRQLLQDIDSEADLATRLVENLPNEPGRAGARCPDRAAAVDVLIRRVAPRRRPRGERRHRVRAAP